MLIKFFYNKALAHASYMVGCQKTSESIVIDPSRDIAQYLKFAEEENLTLVAATDTHVHADYVSGAKELAETEGAKLFLSDEGPSQWKYEYAKKYKNKLLKNGDIFKVGNIKFETLHTPGHTPESLSFLLTDAGLDKPIGIFTGDFMFVGSVGRPDLLEKSIGQIGTAEQGARDLFNSIKTFKLLPDYLQVWPAHGAGSACGKGLGAIPSSTVGYEKMFNPALQIDDEDEFISYILSEQPEVPKYFSIMKKVNMIGPQIRENINKISEIEASSLPAIAKKSMILDTRNAKDFAKGHLEGSINIPLKYLAFWAGWFIDYDKDLYLIVLDNEIREVTRILSEIGIDNINGFAYAGKVSKAGLFIEEYTEVNPTEICRGIESSEVILIDVRGKSEQLEGSIFGAKHYFLGELEQDLNFLSKEDKLVFQCRSGGRSAIATSLAQSLGFKNVSNLEGGIVAWEKAGLPILEGNSIGEMHSSKTSSVGQECRQE